MSSECTTRDYRPDDAEALAEIFRDSIAHAAAPHYSAEQATAWASGADEEGFAAGLADSWTRVACEVGSDADGDDALGEPLGFAAISMPGHIEYLYVAPEVMRQGIAGLLMEDMLALGEAMGAAALTADVSQVAHAFFLKQGFVDVAAETVERQGQQLTRFRMQKRMRPAR
ncbi:MAG: GNAT family N-acetyltransferase [Rhodocyclaceae bacterium]